VFLVFTSGCVKNNDGQDGETQTCEPGWLCIDDYNIGYRGEDCIFRNLTYCRKGCYYDRCIDRPDLTVIEIKSPGNISSGQKVNDTIMPGQVQTNYIDWVAQEGIHNITVVVDGSDFIPETNEDNNQNSILVEVK
jgi:hypothetical protein